MRWIWPALVITFVAYSVWGIYQQHVSGNADQLHAGHCYYVADLGLGAIGYREIPCP